MTLRTRMGMSGSPNVKSFNNRTLSRTASSVPIVTMRNSVEEGSANKSSRSYMETWNFRSSFLAVSPASSRSYLFFALESNIFTAVFEFNFFDTTSIRSIKSAKKDGVVNIRNVCPVGAVSKTTLSKSPLLISWITFASATTSSVPAGRVSMRSPTELRAEESSESLPLSLLFLPMSLSIESRNSFSADVGSISSACSDPSLPEPPAVITGGTPYKGISIKEPPRKSTSSASPRLCAGSVLTTATLCPADAIVTASDELVVVFPTPPLPPQIIIFGLLDSVSSSSNPTNL
mmetsp:Transcript_23267/g.39636  ORF Transcript_23267/g.39636 Transcript_23267/m.39636 type:complete len:290 (+) Transcript_23267:284-1153(+)